MNPARQELDRLLAALQYFTRLPVPARVGHEATILDESIRYFPVAGLLVGCVGAAVLVAAHLAWPMPVAVVLSMVATIVMTGAFHEDGLADAVDGLGGSLDRDRVLEIMKDSRIGAFGALALLLTLLLKFTTLNAMPLRTAALALIAGHAFSRLGAILLMATLPYARIAADSRAAPLVRRLSKTSMAVAGIAAAAPLIPLRLVGAAGGVAVVVVCLLWGRYLERRLGGYSGDCLGAAQQFGECVFYLVCSAVH